MLFECFGSGLFGHLASQFGEFHDCAQRSMKQIEFEASANPNDSTALNALGLRYLQDAKLQLSEQAFRRALQVSSADAVARIGLACSLHATGRPQCALDEILACVESHPEYAPARAAARFVQSQFGDEPVDHDLHEVLSLR